MITFFRRMAHHIATHVRGLFDQPQVKQDDLKKIYEALIDADVGVRTARSLVNVLEQRLREHTLSGQQAREIMRDYLLAIFDQVRFDQLRSIVLGVGVNGSGKTTALAKLAYRQRCAGKKVLIAAADTFRAAAVEQMQTWGMRVGCDVIAGKPGQDPAAVVFTACAQFKQKSYDSLLIDTAGRLQTKAALMQELAKIKRVIAKNNEASSVATLLIIDATLGQNSMVQARMFHESTPLDGLVLTKMDAAVKGGVAVGIVQEISVPIAYVTFGEQLEDIKPFDAQAYVAALLGD